MYVVTVTFAVIPKHWPEFMAAMHRQARQSIRAESGCHQFDVCHDEQAQQVFLYELYSDRSAFDVHLETAHFLDFDRVTADWVTDKQVRCWQLDEART